ncbi:MAG: response regulator [Chromatiaceae bacterium]|jgi:FixJ family two-component response regulator
MTETPVVYIVDDDPDIRKSLALLLRSVSIDVHTFPTCDEFLAALPDINGRATCLLLDVRMPGMSGMALLERLREQELPLPVIMLTGHADIEMAVRAMKLGAADFLTKPFSGQLLLDRVQEVLRRGQQVPSLSISLEEAHARWDALTPREKEVFDRICAGASNKVIAADFGISIRTVESHRARIMEKMKVRSLVDLVLLSVKLKAADQA